MVERNRLVAEGGAYSATLAPPPRLVIAGLSASSGGQEGHAEKVPFADSSTFRYYKCAGSDLGHVPGEENLADGTAQAIR